MTEHKIEFIQGCTLDGCPYSVSIIDDGDLGVASGIIRTMKGERLKIPDLTAEQGYLLTASLSGCNISEVVNLLHEMVPN